MTTVTIEESKKIIDCFLKNKSTATMLINNYELIGLDNKLLEYIIDNILNKYPDLILFLCKHEIIVNEFLNLNISIYNKARLIEYLIISKMIGEKND